jgi:hypothetical protein
VAHTELPANGRAECLARSETLANATELKNLGTAEDNLDPAKPATAPTENLAYREKPVNAAAEGVAYT